MIQTRKALTALLLVFALLVTLSLSLVSCSEDEIDGYKTSDEITNYVRINVTYTDKSNTKQTGDIIVKLEPDVAPITVTNFQNLVKSKFYDGLTFHRVYKGFMIQGGDPDGDGTGGSAPIKGEFAENGWNNTLSHKRGVISMARTGDPNSASSQFFIMHEDNPDSLDGKYAAFGSVVYGMDTVDGIANIKVTYNSSFEMTKPVYPVTINYMSFVTPVS